MARPSYKTYLRSKGRKSVAGMKLRAKRKPGDIEFMWIGGEYRAIVHEAEPESNVTALPVRRRA